MPKQVSDTRSPLRIALDRLDDLHIEARAMAHAFSSARNDARDPALVAHYARLELICHEFHVHLGHAKEAAPDSARLFVS